MYTDDDFVKDIQSDLLLILKKFDAYCRKHDIKYALCGGSAIGAIRHKGFIPWDDDLDFMMYRSEYNKLLECVEKEPIEGIFLQNYKTDKNFPHDFAKLRLEGSYGREWIHQGIKMHEGVFGDIFQIDNVDGRHAKWNTFMCRFFDFSVWFKTALIYPPKKWMIPFIFILELIFVYPLLCNFIPMTTLSTWREKFFTRMNNKKTTHIGLLSGYSHSDTCFPKSAISEEMIEVPFEDTTSFVPLSYDEYLTLSYGDYMTPPKETEQHGKHGIIGFKPLTKR